MIAPKMTPADNGADQSGANRPTIKQEEDRHAHAERHSLHKG